MNCLIITGSPGKQYQWGNKIIGSFTGQLTACVKAEMARLGDVSFEELHLGDINLPYCKGCHGCFTKGEAHCPHAAIYQPIIQKIHEADCLILTSPVYAVNVSALVKGFFDLGAYNHHRPRFFSKKALVISSTAGAYAGKICGYMRDELLQWGFNRAYTLPVTRRGAAEPTPKMKAACRDAARKFYNDAASGKLHNPSLKQIFFYQLWRNFTLNIKDSADYAYWHESELGRHEYAPAVELSAGKKLAGKLINALLRQALKNSALLGD